MSKQNYVLTALFILVTTSATADIVVVANPSVDQKQLTVEMLSNLYLGKTPTIPGSNEIQVVDLDSKSATRKAFYRRVCNKSQSELNAYWSRVLFTGEARRPKELANNETVIEFVSKTPLSIGYVGSETPLKGVNVILKIEE